MAKKLSFVLAALLGLMQPALATETQATAHTRVLNILQTQAHVNSGDVKYLAGQLQKVLIYDTAAHLSADTAQDDGTVAYALDSDVYYFMTAGSWVAISTFLTSAMTNGATISNGTNNHVNILENGEDADIVFSSDLLTFTSTTGATYAFTPLLTATGGLKTAKPLFVYDKVRFCGNGSNGATSWYDGPVLESDGATDFSLGSAACDGNDSGTEGTADRPLDAYHVIKIVGMECVTQAGGTSNTNTFQLRSATADVTGVTCTVTNDGTNAKQCNVILAAPVTITVGATLAVKNVQSGTDDMSAKDMGCTAYYTF